MTGNRGIKGIVEALMRKLRAGSISGFRMHSGFLAPRRNARSGWADSSRYTADNLREIRRRKGVGRPPALTLALNRKWGLKWYPALGCSFYGEPSPNLAEWRRKPHPKDRKAA